MVTESQSRANAALGDARAIGLVALESADYDVHRAVVATVSALASLIATMVRASITPTASADESMLSIDAALREQLAIIGIAVTPPAQSVKELVTAASLRHPKGNA